MRGVLCLGLLGGCVPVEEASGLATEVAYAPSATGEGFRDPSLAVNGVRGAGAHAGSTDVYSVGPGDDLLILGWDGARVFDGPGADLVVFENPFEIVTGGRFIDPTEVEVSPDGVQWVAFPCRFVGDDIHDPDAWDGCAGVTPVWLHEEDHPVDPFDDDAGGDRFDLSELPPGPVTDRILAEGMLQICLRPAAGVPLDPVSNGPDIDGVAAR